jgi:hypothetical protein
VTVKAYLYLDFLLEEYLKKYSHGEIAFALGQVSIQQPQIERFGDLTIEHPNYSALLPGPILQGCLSWVGPTD